MYIINKEAKDEQIEKFADTILTECLTKASGIKESSIDDGLTGIGLAVMFLISNNYVEGDVDNVLEDIDAMLYKNLKNDSIKYGMSCTSGLVGFLVYLVERLSLSQNKESLSYKLNAASFRTVVNKLGDLLPRNLDNITKDVYTSAINDFPVLFIYLKKAIDLGIYTDKILITIKLWSSYITTHIPYYNINKLYLTVSLAYLNGTIKNRQIEDYIQQLVFSINMDNLYREVSTEIMNVNEGWCFVEVLLFTAERLFSGTNFAQECNKMHIRIQQQCNAKYNDALKEKTFQERDMYLLNGFIGIECINTLYPQIFNFKR